MVFDPMVCFKMVLIWTTIIDFVIPNASLKMLQRISLCQCLFTFYSLGSAKRFSKVIFCQGFERC